jgi:DivIVA domain-containing protein
MVVLFGLLGIAVVAAIVLLATNRWPDPGLVDDPGDRVPPALVDVPLGELSPADIDDLRLDTSARGYRMDEVDAVIARLTAELAAREAPAALTVQPDSGRQPDSDGQPGSSGQPDLGEQPDPGHDQLP